MTKGTGNKAHITGEKNLGNVKGDVFSTDRKGNVNYNKTETSLNGFLFTTTILILFTFQLLFGWYILKELDITKQELFLKQTELEKKLNDKIDLQSETINQFIYTYGE